MKRTKFEIANLKNLDADRQEEVAEWAANYTQTVGYTQYNMLQQTPKQILNRMGHIALVDGNLAGYMGATHPQIGPHGKMPEIGSLFVLDTYQRQGIARSLTEATARRLVDNGILPYIFCNSNSLPIAESVGFEPTQSSELPKCATEACGGCAAMLAGQVKLGKCCDTMMIYKKGSI